MGSDYDGKEASGVKVLFSQPMLYSDLFDTGSQQLPEADRQHARYQSITLNVLGKSAPIITGCLAIFSF